MTANIGTLDPGKLVSVERGEIDRRIFSDPEIFEREMELIFRRAWLFLCHETQLPKPGDFFEAPMGRDNVLVVRQRDRSLKALLNTCTHRGNAVCRAEEGNVKNFMCTYHGWTFDLGGNLIGVPGLEKFYANGLDKTKHPLRRPAQLDSYHGFVFATMDPAAPPLPDYLGKMGRLGLDLIAAQGDMEVIPGIQKFVIDCNWKFAVDNLFDWYHPQITHMSARAAGVLSPNTPDTVEDNGGARTADGKDLGLKWRRSDLEDVVLVSEYGHAISGPTLEAVKANPVMNAQWRERPEARAALGPVGMNVAGHPSIFPTAWITTTAQLGLRIPRSPTRTEMWWFSFVDKNATPEQRRQALFRANHIFGPSGLLEQEDGENWVQSTMQTHGSVSREIPQLLKMQLGRGKIIKDDGLARIESTTNEHAQLWTYRAWKEWMSGCPWDELRDRTVPGEYL